MAKQYGPVTVAAYARTRDGALADADTLNAAQRRELATELKIRMLNGFYAGQGAAFLRADDAERNNGKREDDAERGNGKREENADG